MTRALLALLIASCTAEQASPAVSAADRRDERQPAPAHQLSAGCSGGVTGGGGGVTLSPTGSVYRWSQRGPAAASRESVLVATDSALPARLYTRLVAAHFAQLALRQPSNVTCFLEILDGPQAHEVDWPLGSEAQLPQAVRAVYDDMRRAEKK